MRSELRHRSVTGKPASVLPKIVGILLLIGLLRAVIGKSRRHGGAAGWRERRREAIAEFHRQLHHEDSAESA